MVCRRGQGLRGRMFVSSAAARVHAKGGQLATHLNSPISPRAAEDTALSRSFL